MLFGRRLVLSESDNYAFLPAAWSRVKMCSATDRGLCFIDVACAILTSHMAIGALSAGRNLPYHTVSQRCSSEVQACVLLEFVIVSVELGRWLRCLGSASSASEADGRTGAGRPQK